MTVEPLRTPVAPADDRVKAIRRRGVTIGRRLPLVVVIFVLGLVHAYVLPLAFTGDEPRYAMGGLGLYSNGNLVPAKAVWADFLRHSGMPATLYPYSVPSTHPAQALAPAVVFGPLLLIGGLAAARWLDFAIGCFGLVGLRVLLATSLAPLARAAVVADGTLAIVALSLPFMPYLDLLYPEMLLFAAVAWGLHSYVARRRSLAAIIAGCLPFGHVRALPMSLVFGAVIIFDAFRSGDQRRRSFTSALAYLTPLVFWAAAQWLTYGSVLGRAVSVHRPSIEGFWTRAGMQLYDVRHGMFAYAPVYVVGVAGLVAGLLARDRASRVSGILFAAYFGTFIWSSADESWTARFWVAALPMLSVGIANWSIRTRLRFVVPALAMLESVTIANGILFCREPMLFLSNRGMSRSYAAIATATNVDLGRFLPVDVDPGAGVSKTAPIPGLLLLTGGLIAILVALTCSHSGAMSTLERRAADRKRET